MADPRADFSEYQHHADTVLTLNAWLPVLIHFGIQPTSIAEHLILHYNLVSSQRFSIHFISNILTGQIEKNLWKIGIRKYKKIYCPLNSNKLEFIVIISSYFYLGTNVFTARKLPIFNVPLFLQIDIEETSLKATYSRWIFYFCILITSIQSYATWALDLSKHSAIIQGY